MFKHALDLCATTTDTFSFSQGLVSLHDAIDNFLGAIATARSIPLNALQHKNSLMQTFQLIEDFEKAVTPSFVLDKKSEISQLNTHRNNIKHQGMLPNIAQAQTLLTPIKNFFEKYSQHYFNTDWSTVSLVDLVEKEDIRDGMKKVEQLIINKDYKEALNLMAVIKFKIFEESRLRSELDGSYDRLIPPLKEKIERRKSENILPKSHSFFPDYDERIKFLEIGIDIRLMNEFERLTAKVGFNNAKDFEYVFNHDRNWASENWTHDIASYCFDFLLDAILKNQNKYPNLKSRSLLTYYNFVAKEDIEMFDKNNEFVYKIPKEEKIENALVYGRVDMQWEIFDENDLILVFSDKNEKQIFGFIKKEDLENIEFVYKKQFTDDTDGSLKLLYEGEDA